ncbi:MAG: glycosyltransferase family 2 protein [Elusimicrobiales bacterium]|jgi:glycosyltransferase involved in cell wall biosynthesis
MTELTVIITALNEEKNITATMNGVLKAFSDLGVKGEIVAVNDGSRDRTGEIIEGLCKTNSAVRILTHASPRGIGASFWEGVDVAEGEAVVWFPGDNENSPWEIFRYFPLLKHVDIIVPFTFNRGVRSIFRKILSTFYRFIVNATFVVSFNYTNGTILYRKSLLKELRVRNTGFFFQTDMLVRLVRSGYLFAEVPYKLGARNDGKSKALTLRSLRNVAGDYLKLVRDLYVLGKVRRPDKFAADSVTGTRRANN